MKLTKFEHACFTLEKDGQSLVVDPGEYTSDYVVPDNVVGIVITHNHSDHLGKAHIDATIAKNPEAVIIGHSDVLKDLSDYKTQTVAANGGFKVGNFELEFFGGQHAEIDPAIPIIANLGVMINDTVYYPGDSYTVPERHVKVLALPVAAPWMKLSEAVAFVNDVKPEFMFPTHDAVLSEGGKNLPDMMIPSLTKDTGARYERIHGSIDI